MDAPSSRELAAVDRGHMELALRLARRAARMGEVPIGAVLVDPAGRIIAATGNRTITNIDPTAHAEMLAMRQAAKAMGNYRLTGTTLYVTLEPCPMCAGAIVWARVKRVVYAAPDPKAGALGSVMNLAAEQSLNHRPIVDDGVLADQAAALLKEFFASRR